MGLDLPALASESILGEARALALLQRRARGWSRDVAVLVARWLRCPCAFGLCRPGGCPVCQPGDVRAQGCERQLIAGIAGEHWPAAFAVRTHQQLCMWSVALYLCQLPSVGVACILFCFVCSSGCKPLRNTVMQQCTSSPKM